MKKEEEFGGNKRSFSTIDRDVFLERGISDALFIDDQQVWMGLLRHMKKRRMIEKKIKMLK
ncbi:MAG: hypothetical protein ACM3WV_02200 [Bacillota bacterium]